MIELDTTILQSLVNECIQASRIKGYIKSYIKYLLVKEHTTTYRFAKGIELESNQASGIQLPIYRKDRGQRKC